MVRFADDIVLGFQVKSDADQFRAELAERMRKFNLELHPEKTRLLEFGPYAIENRKPLTAAPLRDCSGYERRGPLCANALGGV